MLNSVSPLSRVGRVEVRTSGTPPTSLGTLAVAVVIVVGLYFGREVSVPMALAILLSFALGPPVLLLRRWHLGRVPAVIAVVMLAFLIIGGIGAFVGTQLTHLAGDLPEYQTNIARKIHSLRHATSKGGIVDRTSEMVNDLSKEIAKPTEAGGNTTATQAAANLPSANQQSPVPVEVRQATSTPLQLIYEVAAPLLQPLATAGIVVVFVIFFLLQRKICETGLSGSPGLEIFGAQLWRWTMPPDALAVISLRRRRSTRASACWWVADCGFIGVPTPALWGILGMLLRFVPYIGPVITAALPMIVAFAVDPGWSMLLWTTGLFLVVELTTGQLIEPWLYGHSTGLSGIAVVVAAAFWTLLWGPLACSCGRR